ncbi:DUF1996 domain-containing protein [Niveibacterium microcysteis]|uniref:DUF1996 domain-containing protein n=1 Tax=Niveibacterium microcysteis TaxID=2811415 RepID=A0ABX7M5W4_9RHOO|nr:DUF1996 domain-containing protein [Niveibacterium microcysteis]QSI77154.1 DUF1996 domain-containing protein [Niveibacterium microcysteis]
MRIEDRMNAWWAGLAVVATACVLLVACGGGGAGDTGNTATPGGTSGGTTPPASGQIPAERPVLNPVAATSWSPCSAEYFGGCEFEGLREIRYGTDGKWVIQRYLNSFPGWHCSAANFGSDPAPGETKRCEVSDVMMTGTIAAPNVCYAGGMCPQIDLSAIPMGTEGYGELRVQPTTDLGTPSADGVGAFRTICGFSHMAFDDPIVFPGKPGMSHLHAFFGNTGTNAYSTAHSLAGSGNSTCAGGIANRSAYWVPALIDTVSHKPIVPSDPIWYYKTGYGGVKAADVKPMPAGLRMIAGDMKAKGAQDVANWSCRSSPEHFATIPNCAVGDNVQMSVRFPQCWDGVNLDSANHKSHMAYPTGSGCPATHPVALPEITLNVLYLVRTADAPLNWRLASDDLSLPAGYSVHADWFDGWNPEIRDTWIEHCDQAAVDCHAYLLGDGRTLY